MQKTKGFTKRMVSWVLALVMVCSVMAGGIVKSPEAVAEAAEVEKIGRVTITTREEWIDLVLKVCNEGADTSNAVITLGTDIYFDGEVLGCLSSFSGTLDGKGHAFIGAKMYYSLIGQLEEGAIIKNLSLRDIVYDYEESGAEQDFSGIAARNSGTIINCTVTGSITGIYDMGGIALFNEGIISNCSVSGSIVDGGEYGAAAIGGIVRTNQGIITNCLNSANIKGSEGGLLGGIAGANIGTISNCYNCGNITGTYFCHGIAVNEYEGENDGDSFKGTVMNCYNLEKSTNWVYGSHEADCGCDGMGIIKTDEEMRSEAFVEELNGEDNAFVKGDVYPELAEPVLMETDVDEIVWMGGKAVKLTTKLTATNWKNYEGKTKKGSIVWIVKNEPTELEFDLNNHKVLTKSDTTIATVSKGAVKGKAEGKVYVYAVDTGSMTAEAFVVQVKAAPTTVATYYTPDVESDTVKYTSDIIPEGSTFRIYYKGTTGTVKKGDWKILTDEDLTYTLTVPAKYKDYIIVTENTENDFFEVSVAEGAIAKFGKNKVKPFTVPLVLKNDQTGKKTTFKAVISNPVNAVTLKAGEGTTATTDNDTGMLVVTLDSAKTEQKTGMITETVDLYNLDGTRTDSTKIVRIPHPEQYGFSATSAITLVGKTSANQNKVTLAAVKGQPGQYKITAKKGTQDGTEAYFIIWHNSFERTAGKGYQIVKVVVGEANHVTDMELDMKYGAGINTGVEVTTEENTNNIMVEMPSAKTAKQTAYLTEAILLEKNGENCTDGYVVYKLPCGTEDAFTIAPNGVVTVNGALTAGQKKVSMADVKNDSEYTITAAKGTPEGTEAYLLLYHNPEQYSIISVTVGTPNRVKGSTLAKDETNKAENVVIATETLGDGTMTVITVPYSAAKQTVVVKENRTLEIEGNNTATDVNKVLRMAKADGYEVALNEASVTAKGTLSAAQKKISMALKKKTTDVFNITVAAKTPVGTETYFIIYHNNENSVSGGSYHIVKVIVE